jgi:hypothetical protein
MENKLRSLLNGIEEGSSVTKCSDDSFVSLDETMAQNLRANYGGVVANSSCGNNSTCSNNGSCYGNKTCSGDILCIGG